MGLSVFQKIPYEIRAYSLNMKQSPMNFMDDLPLLREKNLCFDHFGHRISSDAIGFPWFSSSPSDSSLDQPHFRSVIHSVANLIRDGRSFHRADRLHLLPGLGRGPEQISKTSGNVCSFLVD